MLLEGSSFDFVSIFFFLSVVNAMNFSLHFISHYTFRPLPIHNIYSRSYSFLIFITRTYILFHVPILPATNISLDYLFFFYSLRTRNILNKCLNYFIFGINLFYL